MDLLEDSLPPSPRTLAKRHAEFLSGTLKELRDLAEKVTASFDLNALKAAAARAVGKTCLDVFLVEKIFILTFPGDLEVIARLNRSAHDQDTAQPNELLEHRVSSEAATLKFVRAKTAVPVPKVYAVEPRSENPVGARYILEERIVGQPLAQTWGYMSSPQREKVVAQVAIFEGQLMQTRFPKIGSIMDDPSKDDFRVGRLGLSCISPYYLGKDVGPWASSYDFIKAYADAELGLLEHEPDAWTSERTKWRYLNGDGDMGSQPFEYMRSWYRLFSVAIHRVAPTYPPREEPSPDAPFVLHHQDISLNNILVAHDNPARVVGIIDWEGARVVPLWSCALQDHLLEKGSLEDEELTQLRSLRRRMHISHEPTVVPATGKSVVMRCLLSLVTSQHSTQTSVEELNNTFMMFLGRWPETEAKVFQDLVAYIRSDK